MKKYLVVLLIAVMAVSSVFAALTGEVVTTAKYNLYPKEDYPSENADGTPGNGYNNFDIHTTAKVKGSYTVPFAALFEGGADAGKTDNANKGYPYAVVEASLTVDAGTTDDAEWLFDDSVIKPVVKGHRTTAVKNDALDLYFANGYEVDNELSLVDASREGISLAVTLDKAEIIGEGWKLDFLNGPAIANYSNKTLSSTAMLKESCGTDATAALKFDSISGKKFTTKAYDLVEAAEEYAAAYEEFAEWFNLMDSVEAAKVALEEFVEVNPRAMNPLTSAYDEYLALKADITAAEKNLSDFAKTRKYKSWDWESLDEETYASALEIADRKASAGEGITFTWDKYGSIAVAANANEKEVYSAYRIQLASKPDYEITDELKAQASVTFDKFSLNKLVTYMSGKVAYKNATEGLFTANAAIDSVIDNNTKKNGGIEVNADFAYDNNFITGEYYYASAAKKYNWAWDAKTETHKYDKTVSAYKNRFSWFKFGVDGTAKAPKFTPVLSVEGYAYDDQKLVADWKLTASYIENEKSYVDATIGMKDTLDQLAAAKSQKLYGSVATTVTNYVDLEGFGKLTAKIGAEDFLHIGNDTFGVADYFTSSSKTPVKKAKESGFYFNVAAEDFIVDGVDFIFSAADLCKKKAQVFALDVAYDDADKIKATAGFATGLEKSTFKGDHTWIYGDVNVKINEELSAYTGAYAMTDDYAHYYVGGKYVKNFTAEARLDIEDHNDNTLKIGTEYRNRPQIGLYAKVSSTELVKGAELALQYGALNTTTSQAGYNLSDVVTDDAITATCTIKF